MHIHMPATHESNTDGCIIRCLRRIHRMPCRSASYEIVGHMFGTNLGKKPTYYKTLSVIVRSASYELSRSASYEIVGHIFGTNLGKNRHTTRLFPFLSHSPPMLISCGNSRTVDTKQTPPTYAVLYIGLTRHDSHSADFTCNTSSIKNNTAKSSRADNTFVCAFGDRCTWRHVDAHTNACHSRKQY